PAYGPQNDVTLKMPAFEWVHVQLHQQKGMISLSPPTICNSARYDDSGVICTGGPGTLSGIATTKNSKSKGNGAGGVGGNRLIFRYYRPVSAEGGSYLSGLRIPLDSITDWRNT
ncbi:hypothetical protein, partial [Escherichia coli]|uniref:hypothetical protein n=5 Tax=Enterobacterales TaxID=91347 RepID=UPI001A8D3E10